MFKKILFILIFLSLLGCSQASENVPMPLPVVTPRPDWQKVSVEGFQMFLPESYLIGTSIDFDSTINNIRKMGPQFEDVANTLNQNREAIITFAVDKKIGDSGGVTQIIVGKISWSSNESAENYMNALIENLPNQIQVLHSEIFSDKNYPMFQIISAVNSPQSGDIKQVIYGIQNGGAIWQIVFTTPSDEYELRLSEFEQVVETVVIPFTQDKPNNQNGNSTSVIIGVALIVIGLTLNTMYRKRKKEVIKEAVKKEITKKKVVKKKKA